MNNLESHHIYSPPTSPLLDLKNRSSDGLIVGKNKSIFIPNGSYLPARCIGCNQPVNTMTQKKLYKHSNVYTVCAFIIFIMLIKIINTVTSPVLELVSFSPFILFAMSYFFRKKAVIDIGICKTHLEQNRKIKIINLICITLMLSTVLFLVVIEQSIHPYWLVLVFIAVPFFTLIASLFRTDIRVASIKEEGVKIKGAGNDFLHSIESQFFKLR